MSVKITQLEAENVKRIKALVLTPKENGLTVIGGKNNQGKTSVLDAIAWALGGDRRKPKNAARVGSATPPHLKIRLSNGIVVERSGQNSALKVTDESGQRAGQQLLNEFVGQLALDMPKFLHATDREKARILLNTLGIAGEIERLDAEEGSLYSQRHAVGQIASQKSKYAAGLPEYPDVPEEPISAYELIQRQQAILAQNADNQRKRSRAAELDAEKERVREQLEGLQKRYDMLCRDCAAAHKDALDLIDESTEALESDIRNVEEINAKIRVNRAKADAQLEALQYANQYEDLTLRIEAVRQRRMDLLNRANLPLPGLTVENGTLLYQGQPWENMSGSDQLKAAAAIIRAQNPDCGFVLVDKLEQMDTDTLKEFGAWAEAEGLQIISTRVSTGGECSIIIEDGYALGTDRPLGADRTLGADRPPEPPAATWKEGF